MTPLRFSILLIAVAPALAQTLISPETYLDDVRTLSGEEMRGRGTGSPELDKAARYIAGEFKKAGLHPLRNGSYLQAFEVSANARLGRDNEVFFDQDGTRRILKLHQDYLPFNFSGNGQVTGRLVFAGYGITAKEYGYDDYAPVDVRGKIVIVLRHEPQEFDARSVFEGRVYTEHSQLLSKVLNARLHGASGVVFINDMANHTGDDGLERFRRDVSPGDAGIPFVHVRSEIVEQWMAPGGEKLNEIAAAIDRDLKPRSLELPENLRLTIRIDVKRQTRVVHNVAGYLPGSTDEYVVMGAHYDHLGLGTQYSLSPSEIGKPHPGADDNASGTAGVLALARTLARMPQQRRGFLFLAFAGEEIGLLGSSFYVGHPLLPASKAVAMVNMDMIGRIRDGKVYVGGTGTGDSFRRLLDEVTTGANFDFDYSESGGYGSSDHTSFTTREIPVLFFFSGLHADYHKPSDTWDKINAPGAAALLNVIARFSIKLSGASQRPRYVRVTPPSVSGVAVAGAAAGGDGPYFGSIPDFADKQEGIKFADVREGSPAGKAGLRKGDVLVELGGRRVKDLYDFTYLLRERMPGEEVEVVVLRGSERLRRKVLLESRR